MTPDYKLLLLLLAASCHRLVAGASLPEITVHIYDYAGVATSSMDEAMRGAAAVLRQTGVEVRWQQCPVVRTAGVPGCEFEADDATHLVLSVLTEKMSAKLSTAPKQFGLSIMDERGGLPCHAYIFHDRISNLSKNEPAPSAQLLGLVVSHEIGHLLLGTNSHAPTGIMRARWQMGEVKGSLTRTLGFTQEQAMAIQANVQRRIERNSKSSARR